MNTKTFICLLCLAVSIMVATSCGNCSKKIDCPGFNDTLLTTMFPYTDNQPLIFKTDTAQQKIVTLKNTFTTEAYQQTQGGFAPSIGCDAQKDFESVEVDTLSRLPLFNASLHSTPNYKYVNMRVEGNSIYLNNITYHLLTYIAINQFSAAVQKKQTMPLGNRVFTNITEATIDTAGSKVKGIYKVFFTYTEGLVGYTEYPSLKTWVKQ